MISLAKTFMDTIKEVHQERGEKWLADFHLLVAYCEQRWQMNIKPPFDLSYNFVAPAIQDNGTEVVIKLVVPGKEFQAEVETLTRFNGHGMVKVVDVDLDKGILLLERLFPGETLATVENDEEATRIASQVMKKLWIPAPKDSMVPTTRQMEKSLSSIVEKHPDGFGPISKEILHEAVSTYSQMNGKRNQAFLLHGDLHHYNILSAKREPWLAIDPKGLIGDREYDVIQYLLNKLPEENIRPVIEKRIDVFVEELDLDRKRIVSWGFAHAVLANCWGIEDHGNYNKSFFEAIQVFRSLKNG
ncbi:aminoglycoside phosphotransferase family protein [Brevibacillus sp. SYSU BS000544]|uniref:aminoglycoside phosphotransferase family protein n=1 Tax=Brevibacillus sp. SYSU BS000544 TaxID=3416443 RepID=UPI003CE502DE